MRSQVLKSHAFSLRRRGKSTKGESKLHHPHEEQISSKQLLWPQPAPGPCRTGPPRTASARRPPRRSPELQLVQALQQAAGAVGHGGGAAEAPLVGFRVDLRLSHLNLRGGAAKRSPASPAAASGESRGRRRRRHRAGRPPPSDARGGRPGRMRRHRRRRVAKQGQARRPLGSGLRSPAGSDCGCGRELAGHGASRVGSQGPGPEEQPPRHLEWLTKEGEDLTRSPLLAVQTRKQPKPQRGLTEQPSTPTSGRPRLCAAWM